MVQCQNCGEEVENSKFCPKCGSKVVKVQKTASSIPNSKGTSTKFCPNCGSEIPIASTFCSECGANLNGNHDAKFSEEDIRVEVEDKLKETMGNNFKQIIKLSVISAIATLVLGAIGDVLFSEVGLFALFLIVITALVSVVFSTTKEVAIYGGLTGLIVGALQNHLLSLLSGYPAFIFDAEIGNPLIGYLISGIIVAIIGNILFKNMNFAKEIKDRIN